MKMKSAKETTEQIPLYRGGAVVSSMLSSFGTGLRETRLTALLGYTIAHAPDRFERLFGVKGEISEVSLETNHEHGRSDILIETSAGRIIVEAKINATDPARQASRYPTKQRILLTPYTPSPHHRARGMKYINWEGVRVVLYELSKHRSPLLKFLSKDLLRYLGEHHMVKAKESAEVYAREINNETTLNLFLRARHYACKYERNTRLPEALYFAAHFGKFIAQKIPGISSGISYIAKIEAIEVIDTWESFLNAVRNKRGKHWITKYNGQFEAIHKKWSWGDHQRSLLFLGEPRLVFNPSVKKENLVEGQGWLSKRFFSFDELFEAWRK